MNTPGVEALPTLIVAVDVVVIVPPFWVKPPLKLKVVAALVKVPAVTVVKPLTATVTPPNE